MTAIESLKDFARHVLDDAWEGHLDAADVEAYAIELGLLVADSATEADCAGRFPGQPGDLIWRLAPWLRETQGVR